LGRDSSGRFDGRKRRLDVCDLALDNARRQEARQHGQRRQQPQRIGLHRSKSAAHRLSQGQRESHANGERQIGDGEP
jgi:hypothetical protein